MEVLKKLVHYKGIKRYTFMFLVNRVFAGTNPHFFELKRCLLNQIGYNIGNGTKIVGPIYCDGKLTIGDNCWIGKMLTINGNGNVFIGNNCDFAPDILISTGGHVIGNHDKRAGKGETYNVTIGNGCWIGTRASLIGPVDIRDGVVVAACSCVIKTIQEDMLIGGVPAKILKEL